MNNVSSVIIENVIWLLSTSLVMDVITTAYRKRLKTKEKVRGFKFLWMMAMASIIAKPISWVITGFMLGLAQSLGWL